MEPLVSVVIPSYNHARFLPRRLESVLGQTLGDLEVLFLDDASTDHTREAFAPYAGHPSIRATFYDENSGNPFVQWNRGVRAARGRYVWIAESDDACELEFLETLVARLEKHPRAVLAYSNSLLIDEDGVGLGDLSEWFSEVDESRWRSDFICAGPQMLGYLLQKNVLPNASAVVFRRESFLAAGGADESLRLCGDWKMWAQLARVGDVIYVARPLNHFRTVEKQSVRTTTANERLRLEWLRVAQDILEHGGISTAAITRWHERFADDWVRYGLWKNEAKTPRAADAEVSKLALQVSPELHYYFVAKLIEHIGRLKEALVSYTEKRAEDAHVARVTLLDRIDRQGQALVDRQEQLLRSMYGRFEEGLHTVERHLAEQMRFWPTLRRWLFPPRSPQRQIAGRIYRMLGGKRAA